MQAHTPKRQAQEQDSQPKAPVWTWAFVVACTAIPVVSIGGLIPTVLGVAAATACYALGRDGAGPVHRRVLWCSLVTLGAWAAFGTLAWVVLNNADKGDKGGKGGKTRITRSSSGGRKTTRTRTRNGKVIFREEGGSAKRKDPADMSEAERRKIYTDAIERREKIEDKEHQIAERQAAGRSVRVLKKQLEMLESGFGFVAKHHGLSRSELDAIIEEGDVHEWWDD